MIFKADDDKPHRCPACWTIPDKIYDSHGHAHRWYIYRCRYGHRFTRIPLLGRRFYGLVVGTEKHQLRLSWRGWLGLLRGQGMMVSYVIDFEHARLERYWMIVNPRRMPDGLAICEECRELEA